MLNKLFKRNKKVSKSRRDASLDSMKEQFAMSTKTKNLPPRFAEQLLFLEMEMEQDIVDLNSVKKLLELYASAIEYYESIKSDKYFIFKNKTQSLLLKPNVSAAMLREQMINQEHQQQAKAKTPICSQAKEIKFESDDKVGGEKMQVALQQQQKEHNLKVQYINAQDSQENAKIMLCQHKQEQNYTKNIISGEIKNQTNEVLKRLEQRRKSKLEKINIEQSSQVDYIEINHSMTIDNSFEERKILYQQSTIQEQNLKQLNHLLGQLQLQKQDIPQSQNTINSQTDYSSSTSSSLKQLGDDDASTQNTWQDENNKRIDSIFSDNSIFQEQNGLSDSTISPVKEVIDLEKFKKKDLSSYKKKRDNNLSIKRNINDEYQTPNKENNMHNANKQLVNKVMINGFNSSSSHQNTCDSPVHIKMNSYGKNIESTQFNLKWMTASTNNFHTPFQFN